MQHYNISGIMPKKTEPFESVTNFYLNPQMSHTLVLQPHTTSEDMTAGFDSGGRPVVFFPIGILSKALNTETVLVHWTEPTKGQIQFTRHVQGESKGCSLRRTSYDYTATVYFKLVNQTTVRIDTILW